jgi:hypothetical protein
MSPPMVKERGLEGKRGSAFFAGVDFTGFLLLGAILFCRLLVCFGKSESCDCSWRNGLGTIVVEFYCRMGLSGEVSKK